MGVGGRGKIIRGEIQIEVITPNLFLSVSVHFQKFHFL